ncbi:tetratricopeptide repeat protein [Rhodohalobacter mucosus]|uniref:HTH luxR-type domain-containing protein n=1 Tax=Rhodohalobacter mucosus TaxID=2079485 RepID=A0A316TZ30_9BACT|nr:tetratricopeptide repeat protein [Rhodohalobacter mucosus]PWN08134.1 hypothetical protein DDZ15_00420 [Rhodohalobacter mucosus]
MHNSVITIITILFIVWQVQEAEVSTREALQAAASDSLLIHSLIDSSYENAFSNPDRALMFADSALRLSKENSYKKGIAGAHGELGYAYSVKGDFRKAIDHLNHGIAISRAIGDSLGWVSKINDLGSIYKSRNEYESAIELYFEALRLCRELDLQRGVAVTLGNIGLSYFEMDRNDRALEYYTQALELNETLGDESSLAKTYNNIGLLHGDEGRYKQAQNYHEKALKLRKELGYTIEIANSLNNIGRLLMQQGENVRAIDSLHTAMQINQDSDPELSSIIHENLARSYESAGMLDSALVHARKTRTLSEEYGTMLGVQVGYELMAGIYGKMGRFEEAYESQRSMTSIKDSILNIEMSRQINELQTKYETAQKEKEIALLEEERQREAMLRNVFLSGLILVAIIGLLIYNRQKLKIEKNRTELENKKLKEDQLSKDLAHKKRELTNQSLHLVQKNEMMKELKETIKEIRLKSEVNGRELQSLENIVDYSFNLDDDWEQFRHYFKAVHSGFFDSLKSACPDLTPNELRLAALAKLRLSVKETATILGITPASVKTARYRLRKKLGLNTKDSLSGFLADFEKKNLKSSIR